MTSAARILVVTLDAGGTLIEPVEPVGTTYARLARAAGFAVGAAELEAGFRRAFGTAPPLAAPPGTPGERLAFERAWWRAIVDASLDHALGRAGGDPRAVVSDGDPRAVAAAERAARDRFFDATFAHYARGAAWRVFPEVRCVLRELRRMGVTLAVVSNFDGRLDGVLVELGLREPFAAVVVSSEACAAKPDPAVFAHALARVGASDPASCLHVGDSLVDDVAGARSAGLEAAWLDRHGAPGGARHDDAVPRITSLEEVVALVQSPA